MRQVDFIMVAYPQAPIDSHYTWRFKGLPPLFAQQSVQTETAGR